jgi:hypothetical protein
MPISAPAREENGAGKVVASKACSSEAWEQVAEAAESKINSPTNFLLKLLMREGSAATEPSYKYSRSGQHSPA